MDSSTPTVWTELDDELPPLMAEMLASAIAADLLKTSEAHLHGAGEQRFVGAAGSFG